MKRKVTVIDVPNDAFFDILTSQNAEGEFYARILVYPTTEGGRTAEIWCKSPSQLDTIADVFRAAAQQLWHARQI